MIHLHSTHLKGIYSQLFETNAFHPVNLIASEVIQPTKEIEEDIIIFTGDFTTKTDRDFYVTNISMATTPDSVNLSQVQLNLVVEDGTTKNINLISPQGTSATSLSLIFPKRGIKLKRGASITWAKELQSELGIVAGYYSSDRAL